MKNITLLLLLLFSAISFADNDKGYAAYLNGDIKTAISEYRKSAEQGDAIGQRFLGYVYESGTGITQDYKAAIYWYKKAAELGDADSQMNLGTIYQKGQGTNQDYVRAHMWYNIAADQGDRSALKSRDNLQKDMTTSQIKKAQKLARECIANNFKNC